MNSDDLEWEKLSSEKKESCFKYLTLLKRFNKDPRLVGKNHQKWLLENADLPTDLIPDELMRGYWLQESN